MQTDENANPAMYLGDSVYAVLERDRGMIRLTTDSHKPQEARNVIYLKPEVWSNLQQFIGAIEKQFGSVSEAP